MRSLHRLIALTGIPLVLACEGSGPDCICLDPIDWEAGLAGSNVVPPVSTSALGTAELHYDGQTLNFTIGVSQLTQVDSARIYLAAMGHVGPARATLCGPCFPRGSKLVDGIVQLHGTTVDELVTQMRGFGAYLEIRSGGAAVLRGQLRNVVP